MKKFLAGLIVVGLIAASTLWISDAEAIRITAYRTFLDSGTILAQDDAAQADGNLVTEKVSNVIRIPLSDRYRITYGISHMSQSCSLGVDGDSGAVPVILESRQDDKYPWEVVYLDTIRYGLDGVRDTILTNDMAAISDTLFGEQFRATYRLEMETDKDGPTENKDTVIMTRFVIIGYDISGD